MKKKKIISIVGARPQFIKAAAVSREIKKINNLKEIMIHTGQHFDENMSDIFFREMDIRKPEYNLGINSMTHGAMTGEMIKKIEEILLKEKPAIVLVYGDTDSTLAGAIAAKKIPIKLHHIEAGLRSFNMNMPEEINRILTDRISDVLFCPSSVAINNLKREGFDNFNSLLVNSGDVMFDSILYSSKISHKKSNIIKRLNLNEYILCTIHRAENTDSLSRLKAIITALNKINISNKMVLPLHPRTKNIIKKNNLNVEFLIIEPVGYLDMIELIKHSSLIMTDSGGLQKEAFFLKKNCVVLRDETEWTELTDMGFNKLAGANEKKIIDTVQTMLNKESDFSIDLFGNGNASKIIVDFINTSL